MKRLAALILCLLFLPLSGAFCFAEDLAVPTEEPLPQEAPLPHLYSGRMRLSARVYESWEIDEGINHFNSIPAGVWVKIHAVYPTYVLVTYESGGELHHDILTSEFLNG